MTLAKGTNPTAGTNTTLADLVASQPSLAAVFDRLGLDFCCHGQRTLGQACGAEGLDVGQVREAMAGAAAAGQVDDWASFGPEDLADHVVAVHHQYLYRELPELDRLAAKVLSVHGDRRPELAEVRQLVADIQADLWPHLAREERVLFPAIKAVAEGRDAFGGGSIANPIAVMTAEHESVGRLLHRLRAVTGGYEVPGDGCASYRLLYQGLEAVELDTHLHILKENSFLFPAAVALEAALTDGTCLSPPASTDRPVPEGSDALSKGPRSATVSR
jgi:regulator of cell morphogenesis and NO signaling